MTKRESHDTARHVFIVVLTIFVILVFIIFFAVVHREKNPDDSFPIEGPFSVTINDKDYGQVDFDDFSFPAVVKGDRLKISFDMPDTKVPNAILTLYQDNSALRVYFDEKLVLEKGTAASRLVGYGYYSIQLLEEYAGMHVRYELDIVEDENVTTLPKPVINNAAIYLRNFIGDNGFYFIIDIAIVILCLAIMLIACIFSGIQKDFGRLAFLGMSFFMMAVWELCSYDLIRIFTDDLVLKAYLEYLSLYLGPFFLSLYFYLEFFTNAPAKIRKTYNFITGMQGLFPVLALILHFTDIIHLPAILPLFHIILL
ncbi:MAG: hypothetical protein J6Y89_01055, partial [Lachnospiraceae bacterium]|nr:hypothetical protein [Lachnospiraceae bacterium]